MPLRARIIRETFSNVGKLYPPKVMAVVDDEAINGSIQIAFGFESVQACRVVARVGDVVTTKTRAARLANIDFRWILDFMIRPPLCPGAT